MKKMAWVFISIFSLFIVGCAGGPKAPIEQDMEAKKFEIPTNNTANLYVYRNESFGGAINMHILIDNVRIATTGPYTYIMANLEPGEHKIEGIAAEGTSILNVTLLPNTNKFVWQEVKMGVFGARNVLREVPEAQGKSGVLESKLLWHEQPKKISISNTAIKETNKNILTDNFSSATKISSFRAKHSKSTYPKTYKRRTGSGCDCGYGYCYGPRGGRYCITSGGNKSYQ